MTQTNDESSKILPRSLTHHYIPVNSKLSRTLLPDMMRSVLVVLLSLSCAAGFSATSRHALSLGRSLNTVPSSWPLRVLRAVESDKAVADNLEEIEGLDGWLIKMGLKVDERVCSFILANR